MSGLVAQENRIEIEPPLVGILAETSTSEIDAVIQQNRVAPAPVQGSITSTSQFVMVPKPYTSPGMVEITLGVDSSFSRTGILSPSGNLGVIEILTPGGAVLQFNGQDNEFSGLQLQAGVRLFARGVRASGNLNDFTLTLNLAAGPTPIGPPSSISLTAVDLTLDICVPRTSSGIDPPALPQPTGSGQPGATDKWFGGRLVNEQDNIISQERAMLIVRQPQPPTFNGNLQLLGVAVSGTNIGAASNRAQLFTNEATSLVELPLRNPHVFSGAVGPNGRRFFVQGLSPSATVRDMGFQLGFAGGEPDGDRVAVTVGVAPVIAPASTVLVVKKSYTSPARRTITLRTSSTFGGTGTLSRSGNTGAVRLFGPNGAELTFATNPVFSDTDLNAGVQLSAEGIAASGVMDDFRLTLSLTPQAAAGPAGNPITARLTAVDLTMDIFMTRTAAGSDPAAFPQPPAVTPAAGTGTDKWFGGRFIHQQDPGNHQGRALIIVRPVQPSAFSGQLTLRQVSVAANNPTGLATRVQLFDNERPAFGEVAKANPHVFASNTIPAAGLRFFAEGTNVSAALRDTGFQLGLNGGELDGDRVRLTVMRFSNLQANIPSSPARTARLGNSPVARHTLTRGAGALVASDFDTDFTANAPLVLIEGSVQAANPINMSVTTQPAGVPVSWSALRDTRAAPNGDHATIAALSGNPTINRTTGALITDAVGSFHIRPFVDVNGSTAFEPNIDIEPFMIMNLVLVRVRLFQDNSVAPVPTNLNAASDGANGIVVGSGTFNIAAPNTVGVHLNAQVDLTGGGDDGLRGVNQVFAGWDNNIPVNLDIAATFRDGSVPPPVNRREFWIFASNRGVATGGTAQFPTFLPGDAVPVIVATPVLDTGRANPGTGGDSLALGRSRIRLPRTPLRSAATPAAVGQRIIVEAVDSPGNGANANHPGFAAAQLIRYRFFLDFSAFLCLWTNVTSNSGPTNDPADRLYSVLQEIDWRIRGEWTINPATGAITEVTRTLTIVNRVTLNPTAAAVATTVEVRAPAALGVFTRDARA